MILLLKEMRQYQVNCEVWDNPPNPTIELSKNNVELTRCHKQSASFFITKIPFIQKSIIYSSKKKKKKIYHLLRHDYEIS
jgi:hypothetical protein